LHSEVIISQLWRAVTPLSWEDEPGGPTPHAGAAPRTRCPGLGQVLRVWIGPRLWQRGGLGRRVPEGSTRVLGGVSPPQASWGLRCPTWSCFVHISPCPDARAWKLRGFGAPTPGQLRDPPSSLCQAEGCAGSCGQGLRALASPLPRGLGPWGDGDTAGSPGGRGGLRLGVIVRDQGRAVQPMGFSQARLPPPSKKPPRRRLRPLRLAVG